MHKLSCRKAYYIDWGDRVCCLPCGGNLGGRGRLYKMPSKSGSKEWKVQPLFCRKTYNGTRANLCSMRSGRNLYSRTVLYKVSQKYMGCGRGD